MKKDVDLFFVVLIADIIAAIIAYGRIIEVKGALSIVLWLVPCVATIYVVHKRFRGKSLMRTALIASLTLYVCASGLYYMRESYFSPRILGEKSKNGYQYVRYEHNAGAMTSFFYELRQYRVILDTELLSVKIIVNSDFYDYEDYVPQI